MVRFPPNTRCVYCGTAPADTADHVPPKCLFAKDNRSKLISVPSCRECNESFAKDDEYFRNVLSVDEKSLEFPDAKEASISTLRSMQRPDHYKLLESTMRNIKFVEDWTGCIFRGIKPAYQFDGSRINGTVSRIIKGLFWHENKEILLPNYAVHTIRYARFVQSTQYSIPAMKEFDIIHARCVANGIRCIAGNAFEYAFSAAENNATFWILRFYQNDSCAFVSFTVPKNGTHETQESSSDPA